MRDSMRDGNSFMFLCHDINELEHSRQVNLPRVSVVMPLKGFGEHNLHNWKSQVILFSLFGLTSSRKSVISFPLFISFSNCMLTVM